MGTSVVTIHNLPGRDTSEVRIRMTRNAAYSQRVRLWPFLHSGGWQTQQYVEIRGQWPDGGGSKVERYPSGACLQIMIEHDSGDGNGWRANRDAQIVECTTGDSLSKCIIRSKDKWEDGWGPYPSVDRWDNAIVTIEADCRVDWANCKLSH